MRVVALPMDNRPPNYRFLFDLAAIYDIDITLPPTEKLGFYRRAGDVDWLREWLLDQKADAFLVSTEMLCYGGLVASRESITSLNEARKRLETLRLVKAKNPRAIVLASSIIRRASVTVSSEKTELESLALMEYLKSGSLTERAYASGLDDNYLRQYWQLRRRNHEVNQLCLDLVAMGIVDTLVLAIEDTFPGGPHEPEVAMLNAKIAELRLRDRVYIHNGADEVMQELFVRLFNQRSLGLHFDSCETISRIMDFEHQPFIENVLSHVFLSGFSIDPDSPTAMLVIGSEVEKGMCTLELLIEKGKEIYLLDVLHANGADERLVNKVLAMVRNNRTIFLKGFSAWNTASNRLGTLLAQAAWRPTKNDQLLLKFMLERFVDDYLYQTIYRSRLEDLLRDSGEDKYNVDPDSSIMKTFASEFRVAANELLSSFVGKVFRANGQTWLLKSAVLHHFRLPWHRTFECEVSVKLETENV